MCCIIESKAYKRKGVNDMIRIPKVKNTNDGLYVCWGRTEFGDFAKDTDEVIYKLLNTDFEVEINGNKCEVRECRVSALPFNRPWPGTQRPINQSESAGFVSFSADEEVEIKVKRKKNFNNALIRPLSKNVSVDVKNGEAIFKLKNPGNYVLEFGDTHNVLHIFYNEIKEYPDAKKATMYFGPGMHFPGVIYLRDNDTVYIDENAVVFGSIYTEGAKNVKIYGGGVIDNSSEERLTENCYENHTKGTFRIYNSEDISVSDIIFTNSSTWVMSMFNCKNITINNVKIVGHWRYNTDGIDIVNSKNVLIENSFIRSFDDTISIKAIYEHPDPVENITVDNCVMWCGWGKNCEIGIETAGVEYKDIVFRNCDLIHNSLGAMCISNGCYADMHDILFENINVELQSDTMLEVIQYENAQEYDANGETMKPWLILNRNTPYAIRRKSPHGIVRKAYDKLGDIHDIVYKNINVYTDSDTLVPKILIQGFDGGETLRNFTLENIYLNGEKVNRLESFETLIENAENIVIR